MILNLPQKPVEIIKTLTAGSTSLTFEGISENATIDVYTYGSELSHTKSYTDGVLTLTFETQTVDVNVKVRCS